MNIHITLNGNGSGAQWIRVDRINCVRPGNIYHYARNRFAPLSADFALALDNIRFNFGINLSKVTTDPSYQWALDQAVTML